MSRVNKVEGMYVSTVGLRKSAYVMTASTEPILEPKQVNQLQSRIGTIVDKYLTVSDEVNPLNFNHSLYFVMTMSHANRIWLYSLDLDVLENIILKHFDVIVFDGQKTTDGQDVKLNEIIDQYRLGKEQV